MEFNTASKEESAKLAEKFRQIRPSFSFSHNGEVITARISPVEDAQIYEVYTADKARGEYACVSRSASPVHEFRLPGKSECPDREMQGLSGRDNGDGKRLKC